MAYKQEYTRIKYSNNEFRLRVLDLNRMKFQKEIFINTDFVSFPSELYDCLCFVGFKLFMTVMFLSRMFFDLE